MKRFLIPSLVLILSQLACQFLMGTPIPTATPPALPTPVSTSTPSPKPEEINQGTHLYWRETIEAGCKASDDSQGTDYVEKTHVFSPDFSSVVYGDRTYQLTGLHRYESNNEADRPLVLLYSELGFNLEVYNPGDDTSTTPACLIFRFQLVP